VTSGAHGFVGDGAGNEVPVTMLRTLDATSCAVWFEADAGQWKVALGGELDGLVGDDLARAVRAAIAVVPPTHVRIDVADVTFVDSAGLRSLLSALAALQGAHASFEIERMRPALRRLITLNGLEELLSS